MEDYKDISEYWNTQKPSSSERGKLLWSLIKAAIVMPQLALVRLTKRKSKKDGTGE